MKLTGLSIRNFKAIAFLEISQLPNAVILAGQNGCGKSCVLDAIRLLKSAYGSYQQDEWQNWFGEFQIDLTKEPSELLPLFRNPKEALEIRGSFEFSEAERSYIRAHAKTLIQEKIWRETSPEGFRGKKSASVALAANQRANRNAVDKRVDAELPQLLKLLASDVSNAVLKIEPKGEAKVEPNILLELIFSTYLPQSIGVIDFHGPDRNYNRERIVNVNLTVDSSEQRMRQHALYNSSGKYTNIKAEMASAYMRHLLTLQADPTASRDDALTTTLKELFETFFPGKTFLGPTPQRDGSLTFPVRLSSGEKHDIDGLSSGEKEVLYGYLRLHSAAPQNSIIMIDEPELHLNPRLINGLADFYFRNLGTRHNNQLWLVTHSDTLIREGVLLDQFSVYHIQATAQTAANQATHVTAKDETDRLIVDLVGDLATYQPGKPIVIFESTEDAEFDMRMTCSLFPDLKLGTNCISAGEKRRALEVYELLSRAHRQGHLQNKIFSVTDSDGEPATNSNSRMQWDRYHIENYLLEPNIISAALKSVGLSSMKLSKNGSILKELKECARETLNDLVIHRLTTTINKKLISSIDLGFDASRVRPSEGMASAIERSRSKLVKRIADDMTDSKLRDMESVFKNEYEEAINDGSWIEKFRGRDILRRFSGRHVPGMRYEYFRDLLISKMSESEWQPPGMKKVISRILDGKAKPSTRTVSPRMHKLKK